MHSPDTLDLRVTNSTLIIASVDEIEIRDKLKYSIQLMEVDLAVKGGDRESQSGNTE